MISDMQLTEIVDGISLKHMDSDVSVWHALEADDPEELALALVQAYYKNHPIHRSGDSVKIDYRERALAVAKYMALDKLLNQWDDIGERASAFLLTDAEHTQWYQSDFFSVNTFDELLASLMDGVKEGSPTWYIWRDWRTTVLPAAQAAGIPVPELYRATSQVFKARRAVPAIKTIITADEPEETKKEKLIDFMKMVADPAVTRSELEKEIETIRGKRRHVIEQLPGYQIVTANETLIVVRCATPIQARAVEIALQQIVNFNLDWKELQGTFQLLGGKNGHKPGRIAEFLPTDQV